MINDRRDIIIIEDDAALSRLVAFKLKSEKYTIVSTKSGAEAIEAIKIHKPKLMVLDYSLPDYSSYDLVDELKKRDIFVPFISITGFSELNIALRMLRNGAMDFIVKDKRFLEFLIPTVKKCMGIVNQEEIIQLQRKQIEQSESKHRKLVNDFPIPVIIFDQDTIFLSNEAALNLFNGDYSDQQENIVDFVKSKIDLTKVRELKNIGETQELPQLEYTFSINEQENFFLAETCLVDFDSNKDVLLTVVSDITEVKRLEKKLIFAQLVAEEREKDKLAANLHDDLGPLLSSMSMHLNTLSENTIGEKEKYEMLENLTSITNVAITTIRTISKSLSSSSLFDFGLVKTIDSFCKYLAGAAKVNVSFNTNFENEEVLDIMIKQIISRVIKELLNNSIKHANASEINIELVVENNRLILVFEDNGIGFNYKELINSTQRGIGLVSIKNRMEAIKASYKYISEIGEGVYFRASFSLV